MGIATAQLKNLPDTEQSFSEMLDQHKRNIAYVGIALLMTGAGYWFYTRSKTLKEENAERAYRSAMQSVIAGNVPLAQADLKGVIVRYAGTTGGAEGAMQLAKLDYDHGQYAQGVDVLKSAVNSPDYMQYDVYNLMAAGYEGIGRDVDAAKEYEAAVGVSRFDTDRDRARANAAREYEAAGNRNAAIKLWIELANDPKSPVTDEAKVRLGGLEAHITK